MRPTCERPTMDNRSNSSKVPVAFANARRSRSRSTPSGRFISKTGSRPKGTLHDATRSALYTVYTVFSGYHRERPEVGQRQVTQVHLLSLSSRLRHTGGGSRVAISESPKFVQLWIASLPKDLSF